MAKKPRLRKPVEIPTSSMADIAFLLIVFFMLTAVFASNTGLQFQYPKDDPEDTNVQPEEAIHIKILGEGQFVVDRVSMSIEEVGGYVQSKMQQNEDKPVIIQTEPNVPYFVMVDVFDLLKQLEVQNVSIPTEAEIERWRQFGIME